MSFLRDLFNGKAKRAAPVRVPKTEFHDSLQLRFGSEVSEKVAELFEALNLPAPAEEDEYMKGVEGNLVFLDEYGLVIRVEECYDAKRHNLADMRMTVNRPDRINDNPFILSPLLSINVGPAVIEVCAGCHQEYSQENMDNLEKRLRDMNIDFWDSKFSNVGRMPVKTPHFPEGVTVVIDRLSVTELTESINPIRKALKRIFGEEGKIGREVSRAQKELYGPLKKALAAAWPGRRGVADPRKVEQFWALCRQYVKEGKLVSGWNEPQNEAALKEVCEYGDNSKTPLAARLAKNYYAARQKAAGNPPPSMKGPA